MSQKWLYRPINPPSPLEINCYLSVSSWLAQKCPLNHLLPEAKTLFNCQEAFMIYTLLNLQRRQKNGLHALNAAVNYKRPEAWWLEAVGPNCRKRGPAIFQKRCAWSESCRDEQQSETKYCKSERQSGSIEDNKCWSTSPIIAAAFCPWLKQWPLFTVYRRASPWQPGGWRRYRQELFPLA